MRGILIVSEILVQVACEPELILDNHMHTLYDNTKFSTVVSCTKFSTKFSKCTRSKFSINYLPRYLGTSNLVYTADLTAVDL